MMQRDGVVREHELVRPAERQATELAVGANFMAENQLVRGRKRAGTRHVTQSFAAGSGGVKIKIVFRHLRAHVRAHREVLQNADAKT